MTAREARRLAPLLPHLARATEIRRPFALLKSRYHAILKMLDHLGIGVLVLLDDDHILLENAEVQRILDAGDGFRRRADGRLAIPSADAGELQPTLSQVLAELRAGTRQDGATVYLRRRREAEPYVIDVTAFRESGAELGSPVSGALLLVIDPERRSVISTRGLARVYGLTDAEAAVCELLGAGHSTREIADIRGVSIETVKAQSKAILRKTLCANRIELVRRALSIAPPLLDDRGRRED
jgi:DNA-binding CsgD family transcriptional regulator